MPHLTDLLLKHFVQIIVIVLRLRFTVARTCQKGKLEKPNIRNIVVQGGGGEEGGPRRILGSFGELQVFNQRSLLQPSLSTHKLHTYHHLHQGVSAGIFRLLCWCTDTFSPLCTRNVIKLSMIVLAFLQTFLSFNVERENGTTLMKKFDDLSVKIP